MKIKKNTGIDSKTGASLVNCTTIAQWETIAGTVYRKAPPNNPTYDDPLQGCANTCYLIAALSSIAWARPALLASTVAGIGFYSSVGSPKTIPAITDKLPTDSSHKLIYARCSDSGETWPALYEKAYASVFGPSHTDTPNIANIEQWKSPVLALERVTGYASFSKAAGSFAVADLPLSAGKTTKPSVAWTGSSVNNVVGLYPNHSYSLLGMTGNYLVLRNPYGPTIPNAEPTTPDVLKTGSFQGIDLSKIDGTFAYSVDAFKRDFAYFGYVNV